MYCGNNLANKKLLNNQVELGTRYTCMRRGIGKGLNMPFDNSYLGEYIPIDDTQIYCGNSDNFPNGYDRIGSLNQCFSKGVGIGIKQKAENIVKKIKKDKITKNELKNVCRELKLRGYSRFNKDKEQLFTLILLKISE